MVVKFLHPDDKRVTCMRVNYVSYDDATLCDGELKAGLYFKDVDDSEFIASMSCEDSDRLCSEIFDLGKIDLTGYTVFMCDCDGDNNDVDITPNEAEWKDMLDF